MAKNLDIRRISQKDIEANIMNQWQEEEYKEGRGYFVKDLGTGERTGEYQSYDWIHDAISSDASEGERAEQLELNKNMPRAHHLRSELEAKYGGMHKGKTVNGKVVEDTRNFGESLRDEMSSVSDRGDNLSTSYISAWSGMSGEERKIVASDMVSSEVPDDMKGKAKLALREKHGLTEFGQQYEATKEIQIHTPKGEKIYLVETDLGDGDRVYQISHPGTKGFVETSEEAFNSALKSHKKRINKISKISSEEMMNNPNVLMDAWYGEQEVTTGKHIQQKGYKPDTIDSLMPKLKEDDEPLFKPYIASKKKAGYKAGV